MKKYIVIIIFLSLFSCSRKLSDTVINEWLESNTRRIKSLEHQLECAQENIEELYGNRQASQREYIMESGTPCFVWDDEDIYTNQTIRRYAYSENEINFFYTRDKAGEVEWKYYFPVPSYKFGLREN